MIKAIPFVKWAGGKRNMISQLEQFFPPALHESEDITYIEPFVGGGAMLFYILNNFSNVKRVVINDVNKDLIHCYKLIKDNPDVLISRLRDIQDVFNNEDIKDHKNLYYAYRSMYNSPNINIDERACLFIFLNHTCYNGLYRVNNNGEFNVPYGNNKNSKIFNEELILADHKILNKVPVIIKEPGDYKLIEEDISDTCLNFIYFDPPYRPISKTSYFKEYSNSPFGDKEQEELKLFCDKLDELECKFMLSNSDSIDDDGKSYFKRLYEGYSFHHVYAPRFINASPEGRSKLKEVLIKNY